MSRVARLGTLAVRRHRAPGRSTCARCAGPPPTPRRSRTVSVLLPVRDEAAPGRRRAWRALLAQRGVARPRGARARRRLDRRHRRRVAPVAGGDPGAAADRARRCRPAGWASRTPASSSPTPPTRRRRAGLRRRRRGAGAGRGRRRRRAAARRGLDLRLPVPAQIAGAGRAAGAAAAAVVVADVPAAARWPSARRGRRWPRPAGSSCVVDARGYERAGGHAAVRAEVLEDIALVRAVKRAGGRGRRGRRLRAGATAGCTPAGPSCATGYGKSLWAAFGSPAGAAAVVALLALRLRRAAAGRRAARLAGSVLRRLRRRRWPAGWWPPARTGGRAWPDALAHPVSVAPAVAGAGGAVVRGVRRQGRLTWRGRSAVSRSW